ncbi:MAG: alpha-galactosidase [Clostridiales bacterium]|nr:alpha-galactosidase [Clostridiales bacterium]
MKAILSLIQALLFIISMFAAEDSSFKERTDWRALSMTEIKTYSFDSIDAAELKVTDGERQQCREWFDRHVRLTDGDASRAAFSVTVGGKELRRCSKDWTVTVGEESAEGDVYRHGKTSKTTLKHSQSGLVLSVDATIYEEYAACEWTVYINNPGTAASPVVSKLYGADCTLAVGKSDLYVSKGSDSDPDDFRLFRTPVNTLPMRMRANAGRNSSFMPYFNLCGEQTGAVLCVGWTGQWMTTLSQSRSGVEVQAGQETLRGALDVQETLRSAHIALQFYSGGNPLKGFNSLRSWEMDCVIPESASCISSNGYIGEFDLSTCDKLVQDINDMPEELCEETDFIWMDAGWYTNTDFWYNTVGDWRPDPERFPQGLKPLSDAIHQRGMKFLLWYEPERCCTGTQLYSEASKHSGWLLERKGDSSVNMYNLANDDACAYLSDLIAQSVIDNGVDIYRQDFNFDPLNEWELADKTLYGGRKGFEENHYVSNLYRFFDTLMSRIPGLLIDNCASGGRRLDIEMMHRSIPLWRSDYNCALRDGTVKADVCEATQAQTFGLSCWLPIYGTCVYKEGEYAERTNILPCTMRVGFKDVREFLTRNYFPLENGGTDTDKVLAMQFGTETSGVALVYAREKVQADDYTLRLNGLNGTSAYKLTNPDDPAFSVVADGKTLMDTGATVNFTEKPKAAIILYSELYS